MDLASSTVIVPSLPTLSMASAMILPMESSPLAEMVATWAISALSFTVLLCLRRASVMRTTAASMPRLSVVGFAPAVTFFRPSR